MTHRPLALVTGASRGIGFELARLLAAGGHDLILVARSAEPLEALANDLRGRYRIGIRTCSVDLSEPGAAAVFWRELGDAGGNLDVLINNAGIGLHGPLWSQARDALDRLLTLNVASPVTLTRLALPAMLAKQRGHVLNVASVVGFQPGGPGMSAYYASKAFILSFSKGLNRELRGSGVSLTVLCPGTTATSFDKEAGAAETRLYRWMPSMAAAAVARAGYRGMMRGSSVVVPGIVAKLMAFAGELPPRRIALEVNRLLLR